MLDRHGPLGLCLTPKKPATLRSLDLPRSPYSGGVISAQDLAIEAGVQLDEATENKVDQYLHDANARVHDEQPHVHHE